MTFFKNVLSTLTALFIYSFIGAIFFAVTVGGIIALSEQDAPEVKNNSVLYIGLHGVVQERVIEDPFEEIFSDDVEQRIPLLKTLEAISNAKTDDRIKGIFLDNGILAAGYSSLHEIRSALEDFKESGKFIYSYGEIMTEANYYVASVADEIYLNPIGSLEFNGLSANVVFLKGLFDKLDIEAQIFRVGTYKSAVEPFFRKDMSDANREQVTSFINDIHGNVLKSISTSRNISIEELKNISSEMLVREPEDALSYGLISKVGYKNEIKDQIKTALGIKADDKIEYVNILNYIKTLDKGYSSDRVAVIVASGEIVSGKGDSESIGSAKFVKAIKAARESKRVKAVVIRINSPGGSMLASDVIWNEIMLTKAEKPVIASMSDMAASGGYYMAMPCDTIIAQPMTITGSIGIFGLLPNLGKFMENKLGITFDGVNTGRFSNLYRVSSSLTDAEKQIIQNSVDRGYETFTTKASEGRNMNIEDLKAVASGRVWTGAQAKEHGLVDKLGSYNDALEIAAAAAGIEEDYMVTFYPTLKSKWEEFFSSIAGETETKILNHQYGEMAKYINMIKDMEKYQGIQARLPFELEIK
ncbi:signal peptide peptidase SppA [Reichenbachiella versicolor]|uniref:signal peptide peptidase SppA n=1 Tax=Reichenbachiella versicolor TaxID=1821036 RepID=UPI000D6E6D09|nr:signal peptide peptidase SppA [Reichenbachiella versicolor]